MHVSWAATKKRPLIQLPSLREVTVLPFKGTFIAYKGVWTVFEIGVDCRCKAPNRPEAPTSHFRPSTSLPTAGGSSRGTLQIVNLNAKALHRCCKDWYLDAKCTTPGVAACLTVFLYSQGCSEAARVKCKAGHRSVWPRNRRLQPAHTTLSASSGQHAARPPAAGGSTSTPTAAAAPTLGGGTPPAACRPAGRACQALGAVHLHAGDGGTAPHRYPKHTTDAIDLAFGISPATCRPAEHSLGQACNAVHTITNEDCPAFKGGGNLLSQAA